MTPECSGIESADSGWCGVMSYAGADVKVGVM